jgi:protein Mpv17
MHEEECIGICINRRKLTNTAVGSITSDTTMKVMLYGIALAAACFSPVDAFAPVALVSSDVKWFNQKLRCALLDALKLTISLSPQYVQTRPRWTSPITISLPSRGLFMAELSAHVQENNIAEVATTVTTVEETELQMLSIEEQGVRWNMNSVLNNALLVGVSALVFAKVSMIDADVSRGWSAAEVARHVPLGLWQSYMSILTDSPIATKAVTSATVYTIGDVIAQTADGTSIDDLDRARTLRSMLAGLIGHGPLSHVWYNVSENLFTNLFHLTAWWSFIPKIGLDQFFWGPIWNNTYLLLLGLMKGESVEKIWEDVKTTTVPLVLSGLKLWPLAHCVTYGLIPVENRLLWVDLVEIAWVTILASSAAKVSSSHTSGTDEAVNFAKVNGEVDEAPAFVNR